MAGQADLLAVVDAGWHLNLQGLLLGLDPLAVAIMAWMLDDDPAARALVTGRLPLDHAQNASLRNGHHAAAPALVAGDRVGALFSPGTLADFTGG